MPRQRKCSGSTSKRNVPKEAKSAAKDAMAEVAPMASPAIAKSWAAVVKGPTSGEPVETSRQAAQMEDELASIPVAASQQAESVGNGSEPLRPGGLGTCVCRGRVAHVKATYGWIEPLDAIEHPDLQRHGGLIWFSFSDVRPGTYIFIGTELTFELYADIKGLGAEDCHEVYPKASHVPVSATPADEVEPSLPPTRHTPLSFSSKSFTPGLAWNRSATAGYQHYRPMSLADQCRAFAAGSLQLRVDSDATNDEKISVDKVEMDAASNNKRGDSSPASTGTGGESNEPERTKANEIDKLQPQGCFKSKSFLPPPGLPPPPGLEDCASLKVEG